MHKLWVLTLLILAGCAEESTPATPPANAGLDRQDTLGVFLAEHWSLPVTPQGPPPDGFSETDASLEPAVCGACHPEQYSQWQTSLHADAFSPGFAGQLIEGGLSEPFQVRNCQTCHTPLAEQLPFSAALDPNPDFAPALRAQGIVCASCHVRAHKRYGPPRRPELGALVEPVPHGGFEERIEYRESRFCAECHQFFGDAGVNGKPIENTFAEWQASPAAAAGQQCQDCHMPDRAHLWRGIHDVEMVRTGVEVDLVAQDLEGEALRASLVVANTGVGHAFPTYMTPRVFLGIFQVDAEGRELAHTRVDGVIARDVDLGAGEERSDTRVLPGESVKLDYALTRAVGSVALVGRVLVDPDFHYRGVFKALAGRYETPEARALIEEASRRISDSPYVLSEIRLDLY